MLAKKLGLDDFQCSDGWFDRWKKRHEITFSKISGEAKSVDLAATETWTKQDFKDATARYEPEDIFNGDETGLFYQLAPEQTLRFKNEKCVGGKMSKQRLTVYVCANMTGSEKRDVLVIGKSRNPRCFKNIKKLPVKYAANKKAWMTSELFTKELQSWDSELKRANRKVVLILDNCTAHPQMKLENIKLVFLPPNTTSVTQPMDQGVIRSFKCFYK